MSQHLEKEKGAYNPFAYEKAVEKASKSLKKISPDKILAIASPGGTNADLYLFRKMFSKTLQTSHLYLGETKGKEDAEKKEDNVLKRCDEHPNTMGALLMGIDTPKEGMLTPETAASLIKDNGIKALYLMSPQLLIEGAKSDSFKNALESIELLIVHSMFVLPDELPVNFVFASASYAEVNGTFTN